MSLKLSQRKGSTLWYVHGSVNGRRIRQSLGTSDPKKAEEKKAQLEARLWRSEVYGEDSVATFEDAALSYLQDGFDGRFVAPLLQHFRGKLLSKITPKSLRDAARVIYPNAKPATWNRQAVGPARAIINHAADNGMCPPMRVKQFAVDKVKRVSVGIDWIIAFRSAAFDRDLPHLATLCWFLFETGTRISEATGLELPDVDMINRKAFLGKTKNGEEYHAYFSAALRDEIASLSMNHVKVFGYKNKSGVYNVWRSTCAWAKIDHVPPHQAGRHSFATLLNEKGWTANDIAEAGRWKSVRLVQETYVHASNRGVTASDSIGTELAQSELQHAYKSKKTVG